MAQRVLINGFGRIGRTVLRAWMLEAARQGWPGVEIVALNDIAAPETLAHLFEYDSVFGPLPGGVALEGRALVFAGHRLDLTHAPDISALDLSGIDLVMECTGQAERRQIAERGLRAGAGRVLISGPSGAAQITAVIGANEGLLGRSRVVSNASCTTNALAPLARTLDAAFGLGPAG
jgi:glyceraldehyde 3-phosphate dehydrogenase